MTEQSGIIPSVSQPKIQSTNLEVYTQLKLSFKNESI